MRLTLRTLLAYLDDTLEPDEIKDIGQKVAESDAAQELVGRIKDVTRRRRLTVPPASGPANFDPNIVAEYLDNVLAPEQVSELEDTCLNSDVHLAEVAACHQILTLILGEPALVPPTARQRMYGLVHGPEAIPYRKPTPAIVGAGESSYDHDAEGDENLLLGMPAYRRSSSLWWLLPVAAVLLLAGAGLSIWVITRPLNQPSREPVAHAGNTARAVGPARKPVEPNGDAKKDADDKGAKTPVVDDKAKEEAGKTKTDDNKAADGAALPKKDDGSKPTEAGNKPPAVQPPPKPSAERVEVGTYVVPANGKAGILLAKAADSDQYRRLKPESRVATTETLLSLPGYQTDVDLESDVHIHLWGNLFPEQVFHRFYECALVLHMPADGFDADLTLERGRVVISSRKKTGPAKVRLRFHDEVWDIALLEPNTEVGVDLLSNIELFNTFKTGEAPLALLGMLVLRGRADLKVGYRDYPNLPKSPGLAIVEWNNKGPGVIGPAPLPQLPPFWSKTPPAATGPFKQQSDLMKAALLDLNSKLTDRGAAEVRLMEAMQGDASATRVLSVRCLGAMDSLRQLLDALSNERFADVREAATTTLIHWLGWNSKQDQRFREMMVAKNFRPTEVETLLQLLYGFTEDDLAKAETYSALIHYLNHNQLAIRQLSFWRLQSLVPQGMRIRYDPAGDTEQRQKAMDEWKKLIPEGKLPPPLPRPLEAPKKGAEPGKKGNGDKTK